MVSHKTFTLNGKVVNIASILVKAGDVIEIKEKSRSSQHIKDIFELTQDRSVPQWLTAEHDAFRGTVNEMPTRDQIDVPVDEMLIVELYSK
jgi:small subunit ribosomal protein S4